MRCIRERSDRVGKAGFEVMPVDMSRYPANWPEIRSQILRRAGGDKDDPRIGAWCEKCGIENYAYGHRLDDGMLVQYGVGQSYQDSRDSADELQRWKAEKIVVIVLTIAHLNDPDPANCDPGNLAALCQACHNRHDKSMRKRNAAKTRRGQVIAAGQMELI